MYYAIKFRNKCLKEVMRMVLAWSIWFVVICVAVKAIQDNNRRF